MPLVPFRRLTAPIVIAAITGAAFAQEQTPVTITRGETIPFTAIYPSVLMPIDDGSDATIISLQHPEAPLRCDAFAVEGADAGWTAEGALDKLDIAGIEATWAPDFENFKLVSQAVTAFGSGPALIYEGESDNSPLGVPLHIVHVEAVDGGRTYAIECLLEKSIAADARPLVDFIIANFSTRSDGECCIDPATREATPG